MTSQVVEARARSLLELGDHLVDLVRVATDQRAHVDVAGPLDRVEVVGGVAAEAEAEGLAEQGLEVLGEVDAEHAAEEVGALPVGVGLLDGVDGARGDREGQQQRGVLRHRADVVRDGLLALGRLAPAAGRRELDPAVGEAQHRSGTLEVLVLGERVGELFLVTAGAGEVLAAQLAEVVEPGAELLGDHVDGLATDVGVDDAGAAGLVGPLLVVGVLRQRRLLAGRHDLLGDGGAVADHDVVLGHGPAVVLHLEALGQPRETGLGVVGVADLERDHRPRLAVHHHTTDADPLPDPRLDVAFVVEVLALPVLLHLVEQPLQRVGVRLQPGLLAEGGELAQCLDRLDLLTSRGIQVDGDEAEGGSREHLCRTRASAAKNCHAA